MNANQKPDRETLNRWHRDPANWKLGIFYFNPKDKRILPPKRFKALGWTVNFANPVSVIVLLSIVIISFFIIALLSK